MAEITLSVQEYEVLTKEVDKLQRQLQELHESIKSADAIEISAIGYGEPEIKVLKNKDVVQLLLDRMEAQRDRDKEEIEQLKLKLRKWNEAARY